ncbi:DUF1992 domain-containing protein [Herbiconiux sp. A18JL235]|uniref:DUF1992 domain-containing protein n=1 Tax=Herbiconiux sp. A18JL235 TaxID=3152363 RepID=A0AB39BL20_9MICO
MVRRRPLSDARLSAARYRSQQVTPVGGDQVSGDAVRGDSAHGDGPHRDNAKVDGVHGAGSENPTHHDARAGAGLGTAGRSADDEADAGAPTMEQRAAIVEIAITQAMRRGDFDDLPGAGKPLAGLGRTYDPDWWIRQKIERERLTGLGPPALTLRTEHAELDARLDTLGTEHEVREVLTDFNRRVVEARRQLLGGPPVVTPTRDIDAEVEAWASRRDERRRESELARVRAEEEWSRLSRRERRAARRNGTAPH